MKQRLAYLKEMCEFEMFIDSKYGDELIKMVETLQKEAVRVLRQKTGFGMFDCRKALEKTEWDILLAEWYLIQEDTLKIAKLTQKRPN